LAELTIYHAKFFAHELLRRLPSNDVGKLTASLQDAQVDLNPHQVEAALFAFKSPLSQGAILADEVGLGKTIEAGIILSQQWAEGKRKLLIIGPSNLRKQWHQELADKFFLPSMILEAKSFNNEINSNNLNPFSQENQIVICSFHFARNKAPYIKSINWDLVIIDEAHRLRNVYKPSNVIANTIKKALSGKKKVLLTATPLQNSVLELYGLVSIVDEYVFGDLKSFKAQYSRQLDEGNYEQLKERLAQVSKRTLRRQVLEYINYTERKAIQEAFIPYDDEQLLYDKVSEYLQRPKLYALPNSQRQLITLILRKLLASSTYAIYGTLESLVNRLENFLIANVANSNEDLSIDYEEFDEVQDEWDDENEQPIDDNTRIFTPFEIDEIKEELNDLKSFRDLAKSIRLNSKGEHLFTALQNGFSELKRLGANEKALIFTESRRTQDFLFNILEARGYKDKIVKFNGTNNDSLSKEIYRAYLKKHKGTDVLTGSKTADTRAAIVDYFKNHATIMVATEAAAEGINLQFCSLVVNYDLPWNPQRIEQRIGRCHRYGQKFDVVVVNFLNQNNAADIRVYELLSEKFKLFDGVFGASDEVLGALGNGVDFEKRIAEIYHTCRTPNEIQLAFDQLQSDLEPEITDKVSKVKTALLENFDEEVREKLRVNLEKSKEYLGAFEQKLWKVTKHTLQHHANFNDSNYSFNLFDNPYKAVQINLGEYQLSLTSSAKRNTAFETETNSNKYRVGHKLAQWVLKQSLNLHTPNSFIEFDYSNTPTQITKLAELIGQTGWLKARFLSIDSFESEDYLLVSVFTENGNELLPDDAQRIFSLHANIIDHIYTSDIEKTRLDKILNSQKQNIISNNALRNRDFFDEEMDKLELWADDMKLSLEKELKDLDAEIKLKKSEAKKMMNLEQKVKAQRQIKDLEKKRNQKRQRLFLAQDEIDEKKENLLSEIENRLNQKITEKDLFTIKWKIV
jgi:superfamily II DNA/RNA helicase